MSGLSVLFVVKYLVHVRCVQQYIADTIFHKKPESEGERKKTQKNPRALINI